MPEERSACPSASPLEQDWDYGSVAAEIACLSLYHLSACSQWGCQTRIRITCSLLSLLSLLLAIDIKLDFRRSVSLLLVENCSSSLFPGFCRFAGEVERVRQAVQSHMRKRHKGTADGWNTGIRQTEKGSQVYPINHHLGDFNCMQSFETEAEAQESRRHKHKWHGKGSLSPDCMAFLMHQRMTVSASSTGLDG